MSKFKISALISAICLMGIVLCGIVGFSQTPRPTVQLSTNPPIHQILPFEAEATRDQTPVSITLQAVDAVGQPLKNAKLHLQILTPAKTPWFSTDFPLVEGTELLEMETIAPEGILQFQQMFPIRGTYQFLVDVTPQVANAFTPFQQKLTLTVPENWVKYKNLGILVVVLLAAGLGGGWVIGRQQSLQVGEIVPQSVRLLLSGVIIVAIAVLLFVNISAEVAEQGMSEHGSHMHPSGSHMHPSEQTGTSVLADQSGRMQSQGLELKLSGDMSAIVGQPANLQVKVIDSKTSQPVTDVSLKATITQLENNWIAFTYEGFPDTDGQLTWQQQFFDGAPHQLAVEIAPTPNATRKFQPFQVTQTVEVAGVAPPTATRLITLLYFTGIVGIGLLLGLWLQRRRINRISSVAH